MAGWVVTGSVFVKCLRGSVDNDWTNIISCLLVVAIVRSITIWELREGGGEGEEGEMEGGSEGEGREWGRKGKGGRRVRGGRGKMRKQENQKEECENILP